MKYAIRNTLGLYERNFALLMALLPRIEDVAGDVALAGVRAAHLHLSVLERSRYTSTVLLYQDLGLDGNIARNPRMKVRIYHDARVAEVIGYQNHHRFKVIYPYPNPRMYQPLEKFRINQFLEEWLRCCVRLRPVVSGW